MIEYHKISVIIPAYNEEATIVELIEKVQSIDTRPLSKEIIVVDDGSKDKTRETLKQIPGIKIIFHEHNKGKGGAIKTGIENASGDILLIQDADLEYDPINYPELIRPILKREADIVMGSRFLFQGPRFFTKNGDPFFSHFVGNIIIRTMTNLLYGQNHTDYEGCYKVFTAKLARAIPIQTNGFAFDNELICKALRRKFKLVEVPIRYKPRLYEEGKKITWRDGVIILWTIFKWRFLPF